MEEKEYIYPCRLYNLNMLTYKAIYKYCVVLLSVTCISPLLGTEKGPPKPESLPPNT